MPRRAVTTLIALGAATLAAVASVAFATSASADTPLSFGSWTYFNFDAAGSGASGEPFTFVSTQAATVEVSDGYSTGDQFAVYDNGFFIGTTNAVPTKSLTGSAQCGPPDVCNTDPRYSHGAFLVLPGSHSITIVAVASPFGGGTAFLRATDGVNCGTTLTGVQSGVTVTHGVTCLSHATVNGGVSISGPAIVYFDHSTVTGSVSGSHAGGVEACGSTLQGAVAISGATGLVELGNPGVGCAGNHLNGQVTLTHDTGSVIVVGNHLAKPLMFSGLSGQLIDIGPNP